jgi:imidazolonepropionase-like amidohydrolase
MNALLILAAGFLIHDVRVEVGDGTVIEKGTVQVEDGRIVEVRDQGKSPAQFPVGVHVIDGHGKTLTPGLIAVGTQLGIVEVSLEPSSNDSELQPPPPYGDRPAGRTAMTPGFSVAWGFNPESAWIPVNRQEGITSTVVQPSGGVLAGQGAWVDLTGHLADRPDPAQPSAMFGGLGIEAVMRGGGARGGVWLQLREALADARYYRQNRASFDHGDAHPLLLSPFQLEALFPVLDQQIPLVLAANRASDILDALTLARTEHIRIVIQGGAEAWKVVDQLHAMDVAVIIEPSQQEPASFDRLASRDDLAAVLHRGQVPVIITATGFPTSARRVRQEAGIAVGAGMSRRAAIQAITLNAARAFGRDRDYGSVTAGKRADLVLWSGDPLELSTLAESLWIGGEEQPLRSRQDDLFDRYASPKP